MPKPREIEMRNQSPVPLSKPVMDLIRRCAEKIPDNREALRLIRHDKIVYMQVLPEARGIAADTVLYNIFPSSYHGVLARIGTEGRSNRRLCVALVSFPYPFQINDDFNFVKIRGKVRRVHRVSAAFYVRLRDFDKDFEKGYNSLRYSKAVHYTS